MEVYLRISGSISSEQLTGLGFHLNADDAHIFKAKPVARKSWFMDKLPVRLYAAFAADERGGNIGAVVFEDEPLWPDARQRIASDLGAPTTGFVRKVSDKEFQTRFHSTWSEMDMCGHVTLAVFAALRDDKRIEPDTYIQQTSAGGIVVDVASDGFVTMRQPLPKFDLCEVGSGDLAANLGLEAYALKRVSTASTALRHVFVQLEDLETLASIRPDDAALRGFCRDIAIDTIGVWCSTYKGLGKTKLRLRDLCHGVGDPEEAASGTTNSALACELVRSRYLTPGASGQAVVVAEQGVEMGRPSIVRTVLNTSNGEITDVSVGGYAALRMTGDVVL